MSQCIIKEEGLCPTCSLLGRKTNGEPCRTLDLRELCKSCLRKTRSSYMGAVKESRKRWAEEE